MAESTTMSPLPLKSSLVSPHNHKWTLTLLFAIVLEEPSGNWGEFALELDDLDR